METLMDQIRNNAARTYHKRKIENLEGIRELMQNDINSVDEDIRKHQAKLDALPVELSTTLITTPHV